MGVIFSDIAALSLYSPNIAIFDFPDIPSISSDPKNSVSNAVFGGLKRILRVLQVSYMRLQAISSRR